MPAQSLSPSSFREASSYWPPAASGRRRRKMFGWRDKLALVFVIASISALTCLAPATRATQIKPSVMPNEFGDSVLRGKAADSEQNEEDRLRDKPTSRDEALSAVTDLTSSASSDKIEQFHSNSSATRRRPQTIEATPGDKLKRRPGNSGPTREAGQQTDSALACSSDRGRVSPASFLDRGDDRVAQPASRNGLGARDHPHQKNNHRPVSGQQLEEAGSLPRWLPKSTGHKARAANGPDRVVPSGGGPPRAIQPGIQELRRQMAPPASQTLANAAEFRLTGSGLKSDIELERPSGRIQVTDGCGRRKRRSQDEDGEQQSQSDDETADLLANSEAKANLSSSQRAQLAADELPSHGHSLAKWRLMQKSEASMVHSALINERAQLVCDIQAPSADDSVALILWYKDDSLAPIYTIDARKVGSLDKAKVIVDERYNSRLTFNMRTRPAQLELAEAEAEDEGEYRCRVDFKRGRTVNTIISLRIVEPASELAIYVLPSSGDPRPGSATSQRQLVASSSRARPPKHEPTISSSGHLIGPFDEQFPLELLCVARGGKPRPQLQWRRDFNVINTTASTASYLARQKPGPLEKDETGAVLLIDSLNRQHALSIFTCQAANNNLTGPIQSSVSLDLNLKPDSVSIRRVDGVKEQPLLVGQTATFECISRGSKPQATIHWIFQGQRHDSPMSLEQEQTSSRLTLVLQRAFNGQSLTCVAENPRILANPTQAAKQTTIKLDVHYPPQLSIKLDDGRKGDASGPLKTPEAASQSSHLQEGNDIYLTCHVEANPQPNKPVMWRFNGRPIAGTSTPNGELGGQAAAASAAILQSEGGGPNALASQQQQQQGAVVISSQSLVLRKVSRHQRGNYTCEASNQHGSSVSTSFELTIRHAPVCATDQISVFEASVGQVVTIDCQVEANPSKSLHFSWFVSSGREQNLTDWLQRDAGLDEQIDESSSRLKFRIRDENGFALIKCKAKNEIGLQQKTCLFQLAQAKAAELQHTCSLAAAHPSKLQLQCRLNEHLKTNEFQMSSGRGPGSRPASGFDWIKNFQAIKQSLEQGDDLALHQTVHVPPLRQVFPPDWLLAELYRANESAPGQLADSDAHNDPDYELQAYILVAAPDHLASIKSIVEENKLFETRPRDVYYVMAKELGSKQSSSSESEPSVSSLANLRTTTPVEKEPTIRMADQFNFTVPNLEPGQRYKLLIYGQNLANRTRDWVVVKGETLNEHININSATEVRQKPPSKSFRMFPDLEKSRELSLANSSGGSKSLVMRSELPEESLKTWNSSVLDSNASQLNSAETLNDSRLTWTSMFSARDGVGRTGQLFGHLYDYRDQALAYARQKPLLTIPMALVACIALVLLLVYLSGLFVALLRGRRSASTTSTSSTTVNGSNSSYSSVGSTGGSSSGDETGKRRRRRKRRRKQSNSKSQEDDDDEGPEADGDSDEDFKRPNGNLCTSPQVLHYERGSSAQSADHQLSSSSHSPGQLNSSAGLLPSDQFNAGLLLQQRSNLVHQPEQLDALALEQVTPGGAALHLASSKPSWMADSSFNAAACNLHNLQQQRFLGSLDRRQGVSMLGVGEQIYLADAQVANFGHHHQQQLFGSIDRRQINGLIPSLFVQQQPPSAYENEHQHSSYQPLFITTTEASSYEGQEQDLSSYGSSSAGNSQRLNQKSPSFSRSPNGCIMSQMDRLLRQQQALAIEPNLAQSLARRRKVKQAANSSQHHRVAFDLSHQQPSSGSHLSGSPECGLHASQMHSLANKCPQDTSSGSNNSTAATADSGVESPPQLRQAANLYANGCTTGPGHQQAMCHKHLSQEANTVQLDSSQGQAYGRVRKLAGGGKVRVAAAAGSETSALPSQMVMLMEFASPSSQESSTLLHSADSFGEQSSSVGTHSILNQISPEGDVHAPASATTLMLQQNHQMSSRI